MHAAVWEWLKEHSISFVQVLPSALGSAAPSPRRCSNLPLHNVRILIREEEGTEKLVQSQADYK